MADETNWPTRQNFYFGIKAGADYPLAHSQFLNDTGREKSLIGSTGGVFAGYDINDIFALQLELNYFATNIFVNSYGIGYYYETYQYVQVPLLLKANCFLKSKQSSLYVDLGPVFDLLFADNLVNSTPTYESLSGIIGLGIDSYFDRGNAVEFEIRVDRSIVNNTAVNYNPGIIYFTMGYIF